jgi:hypothetical protein
MQSEQIKWHALHKHQQRSHLCAIQDILLIFSLSHLLVHHPIEGTHVGSNKGDVRVSGVLSNGHNVLVLVRHGHTPATKDGLDLFSGHDFTKEEEHL